MTPSKSLKPVTHHLEKLGQWIEKPPIRCVYPRGNREPLKVSEQEKFTGIEGFDKIVRTRVQ